MTTTVRPRTPAELAVLVPYQLGYHPGPSVVLTVLTGRRLGLLQRHDLIDDPDDCRHAADRALQIVDREGATALLVIAFEDDDGSSAPLREAVLDAAERIALPVHEHVVVRDGRWYAPDCHETCCPEEGLALPRPEDVPAVAPFVRAGVAPLPGREELVGDVLPERDEERAAQVQGRLEVLAALARGRGSVVERGERLRDTWQALLDPDPTAPPVGELGDALLARAALSLVDVLWRDALMAVLCPGTLPITEDWGPELDLARSAGSRCPWVSLDRTSATGPGEVADEVLTVRTRLVELNRLLPEAMTPPTLTLIAHLAWWSGDGTVAGIALERALEIDPGHRLARLMNDLLSSGLRPWADPGRPGAVGDGAAGSAA